MVEPVAIERLPNRAVIESLERILERAKDGRLTGFVLAGTTPYGDVFTAEAGERQLFSLVGAVHCLTTKMLIESDESVAGAVKDLAREVVETG